MRLAPLPLVAVIAIALVVSGCGKPAFCQDLTNLKKSVDTLKSVKLTADGISQIQTNVQSVKTNAETTVAAAKADFPTQTAALQSSVATLETAVKALPANPTAQDFIPIAIDVASAVSAYKTFQSATQSACK